jgi:transcriptional regulator with XRE-family HTH domain
MSQRQLADELDLSNATISRLVSGKSRYPDVETLIKLADHFGVTTDYLLGRES